MARLLNCSFLNQKGKIRDLTDTEKMVFCKINKDFCHQNRKLFKELGA